MVCQNRRHRRQMYRRNFLRFESDEGVVDRVPCRVSKARNSAASAEMVLLSLSLGQGKPVPRNPIFGRTRTRPSERCLRSYFSWLGDAENGPIQIPSQSERDLADLAGSRAHGVWP